VSLIELLRPPEHDHVGSAVACDAKHMLARHTDTRLERDQLRVRAVAPEELLRPGFDLVLRLIAEQREIRVLVDVERDHLQLRAARQLKGCCESVGGGARSVERNKDAAQDDRERHLRRNHDERLADRACELERHVTGGPATGVARARSEHNLSHVCVLCSLEESAHAARCRLAEQDACCFRRRERSPVAVLARVYGLDFCAEQTGNGNGSREHRARGGAVIDRCKHLAHQLTSSQLVPRRATRTT
jgi:hypothetical protein